MIEIKNLTIEFPMGKKKNIKSLSKISLLIEDYDNVAIIGKNGSGKSTLLKALAGVYHPKYGSIQMSDDFLTIFDLSLGIERDESGFNNVIIRGLYYGLTEKYILENMNKVREFAALGDFFDQPVRVYSAGMKARLAFSILTLINREIYLIDEVIGVGDKRFYQKTKNLIRTKAESCKNFILASHSEDVLKEFCNKGLLLNDGKIEMYDDLDKVLKTYKN